jgi:subtilisin family serine protease
MEYKLPPIRIDGVMTHIPYSEQYPEFHTRRGNPSTNMERGGDGTGIHVGVGDTGVDKRHHQDDLSGVVEMRDFTNSRFGPWDNHFHGSHCLGHIGARLADAGMVGLAPRCTQYSAKVLGDGGSGDVNGIASGIRWMASKGCHIISLSLGGGFSSAIENACKEVRQQGVIIFAAMGNDGTRGSGHPGNSKNTIGVCAVDYNKELASFSSRSIEAYLSGYGVGVLSCGLNGTYVRSSGTSMATPDQAGICAKILGRMQFLKLPLPKDQDAYFNICVKANAVEDLGAPGRDVGYGFGFIDINRVFQYLDTLAEPVDPPPPGRTFRGAMVVTDNGIYPPGKDIPTTIKIGEDTYTGTVGNVLSV